MSADDIEGHLARAHAWHDEKKKLGEEAYRDAVRQRVYELGALLYEAPGDCQHELLKFLGTTVMRMPVFILGSAQYAPEHDADGLMGLSAEFVAMVTKPALGALGPILDKLRETLENLERIHAGLPPEKRGIVMLYDSTKPAAGQA